MLLGLAFLALGGATLGAEDSLPPLPDGRVAKNLDELWGGYDPAKEPLETQVVRQWQEGEATCRHVVFTVGTFRGKPSRIAAFYAFPKSAGKLPAILDLHGGGQRAGLVPVIFMARNGYAGLSINWGGEPMEGAAAGDPNTDWGALDATQKGHNSHYGSMKPDAKTLDAVGSPRNNNWFLLVLAARRGLTFLQQQPEVDAGRLGVCGHSMGGKLTTDLAGIDARVKVAVPSCGGSGVAPAKVAAMPGSGLRGAESQWMADTIDDGAYIPRIRCPIMYLSPTNDFNGPLDSMVENWRTVGSRQVRYAISPHLNHRHAREFSVSEWLWFDEHLNGGPPLPRTPALEVSLNAPDGVPMATLKPDCAAEVVRADIYYSLDPHVLTRFWRDGQAKRQGDAWIARCPVMGTDQPLYVHANVYYPLRRAFVGYQWMDYRGTNEFAISSTMATVMPADLAKARIKATDAPETTIDDFARGWQDWYRLEWANPQVWAAATRKVKDPKWRGPDGARLAVDVKSPKDVELVIRLRKNDWGAYPGKPGGAFAACKIVKGTGQWQTLVYEPKDFSPTDAKTKAPLENWRYLTELELCGSAEAMQDGQSVKLGGQNWPEPRLFRNLRWVGNPMPALGASTEGKVVTPRNLG
jgi:hypothetical protein